VVGVQGMFEGSGMEGSNADPGLFAINSQIQWLATVKGRVVYVADGAGLRQSGGVWVRHDYDSRWFPQDAPKNCHSTKYLRGVRRGSR
jgi:hypothetical protein